MITKMTDFVIAESLTLGLKAGLDVAAMLDVLTTGAARSWILSQAGELFHEEEESRYQPTFTDTPRPNMEAADQLIWGVRMAGELGVPVPMAGLATELMKSAPSGGRSEVFRTAAQLVYKHAGEHIDSPAGVSRRPVGVCWNEGWLSSCCCTCRIDAWLAVGQPLNRTLMLGVWCRLEYRPTRLRPRRPARPYPRRPARPYPRRPARLRPPPTSTPTPAPTYTPTPRPPTRLHLHPPTHLRPRPPTRLRPRPPTHPTPTPSPEPTATFTPTPSTCKLVVQSATWDVEGFALEPNGDIGSSLGRAQWPPTFSFDWERGEVFGDHKNMVLLDATMPIVVRRSGWTRVRDRR